MDALFRGTTPVLEFELPFEADQLSEAYVTLAQNKTVVVEHPLSDCTIDGTTLSVTLTQEETLSLKADYQTEIQLRIKTLGEEALASEIINVGTKRILKDGVI